MAKAAMGFEKIINKYSENVAGLVSLMGSTALVAAGDVKSIAAAGVFTAAEFAMARFGNSTLGYALSATGFAAGDLVLAFSDSVQRGSPLQISLLCMAGAWTVGALSYPFNKAAQAAQNDRLQAAANWCPTICGTSNLALRLPGIFAAASSGNYILTGAIAAWGIADILAGRLQDRAMVIYRGTKKLLGYEAA